MTGPRSTPSDLEVRLARLEANEQLRRLAHDYCHGIDKRDLDRFLSIWADDAEYVPDSETTLKGHSEIATSMVNDVWPIFAETHHWTSNQVVDWSDSMPRGTSDVSVVVRNTEGQWIFGSATYADTYAIVDGRWLISRREATLHFTRPLAMGIDA